jgi:transposase
MYFRYNQPYNVTMGPRAHSFLEYPPVQINPMCPMGNFIDAAGVRVTTGSPTADTVIKYGFWVGMALVAYRLYRVMRYDDPFIRPSYKLPPAWQANPLLTREERNILLEEIRSQHERGATTKEIAERLGIKIARVSSYIKKMGLTPRKHSLKSDEDDVRWKEFSFFAVSSPGERIADLARDFGITTKTAYEWLSKAGVNITAFGKIGKRQPGILGGISGTSEGWRKDPPGYQQLVLRVLEVYEPGMNVAALAKDFNVSYHTMRNLLIKEGVYKPVPPLTLQKSQAIKRGLRQYHQKRRRSSRKNPGFRRGSAR